MSQCSIFKLVKCHCDDIFRQDYCLLEKAHAPAALVWLLFIVARLGVRSGLRCHRGSSPSIPRCTRVISNCRKLP
jgi:hypothetical protein